jgi:hypothetical protein
MGIIFPGVESNIHHGEIFPQLLIEYIFCGWAAGETGKKRKFLQ